MTDPTNPQDNSDLLARVITAGIAELGVPDHVADILEGVVIGGETYPLDDAHALGILTRHHNVITSQS